MRCAVATLRADTRFASLKRVCQYHRFNHRIPRGFHSSTCRYQLPEGTGSDPRLEGLGKVIEDEYAVIREVYGQLLSILSSAQNCVCIHAKKVFITTDSLI